MGGGGQHQQLARGGVANGAGLGGGRLGVLQGQRITQVNKLPTVDYPII